MQEVWGLSGVRGFTAGRSDAVSGLSQAELVSGLLSVSERWLLDQIHVLTR